MTKHPRVRRHWSLVIGHWSFNLPLQAEKHAPLLLLPFISALLLGFAGCSRSPENLIVRQIAVLDETADALATITDEDSAKAAAPTLSKLQRRLSDLIPEVKALELSTEERDALEDEHREPMNAALTKYRSELSRVRQLQLKAGGLSHLEHAVVE
jgi:hypothetical protein